MSEVIVFVGPTLSSDEVQSLLPGAMVRPPVALGDVFRSLQHRPDALVIIDGLVERVPAVWHKELLWAIDQGVSVYGASSMGALRAAELAPFGMIGVGEIFNMLTDGRLEDDDEVTLVAVRGRVGRRAAGRASRDRCGVIGC